MDDQAGGVIQPHPARVAHDPQPQRPARWAFAVGHHLPALVVEIPQAFQTAHDAGAGFIRMGVDQGQGQPPEALGGRSSRSAQGPRSQQQQDQTEAEQNTLHRWTGLDGLGWG